MFLSWPVLGPAAITRLPGQQAEDRIPGIRCCVLSDIDREQAININAVEYRMRSGAVTVHKAGVLYRYHALSGQELMDLCPFFVYD